MFNPKFNGDEKMWDQYCKDKVAVVEYIMSRDPKINRIGEIGVYAGYGAIAIMEAAKGTHYYGWDILSEDSAELKYANSLLRGKMKRNPWDYVIYFSSDTQCLNELHKGNLDLLHVDGDHHPAACYHDMQLAYKAIRNNGWIVVDDYNESIVQDGVDFWVQKHKGSIRHEHFMPGITGNYIIQIGEVYGI